MSNERSRASSALTLRLPMLAASERSRASSIADEPVLLRSDRTVGEVGGDANLLAALVGTPVVGACGNAQTGERRRRWR